MWNPFRKNKDSLLEEEQKLKEKIRAQRAPTQEAIERHRIQERIRKKKEALGKIQAARKRLDPSALERFRRNEKVQATRAKLASGMKNLGPSLQGAGKKFGGKADALSNFHNENVLGGLGGGTGRRKRKKEDLGFLGL